MKNYIILLFIFVFTLTSIPTYNFSYSSFEQLYNFEQETYKTELEEELEEEKILRHRG